jgi:hypothetical protein
LPATEMFAQQCALSVPVPGLKAPGPRCGRAWHRLGVN